MGGQGSPGAVLPHTSPAFKPQSHEHPSQLFHKQTVIFCAWLEGNQNGSVKNGTKIRTVWVVFRPRRGRLEFGHFENYLGHGVRRDALLTTAGEPGRFAYPFYPILSRLSAVSKASRLTFPGLNSPTRSGQLKGRPSPALRGCRALVNEAGNCHLSRIAARQRFKIALGKSKAL
jgi:hypothetical protein